MEIQIPLFFNNQELNDAIRIAQNSLSQTITLEEMRHISENHKNMSFYDIINIEILNNLKNQFAKRLVYDRFVQIYNLNPNKINALIETVIQTSEDWLSFVAYNYRTNIDSTDQFWIDAMERSRKKGTENYISVNGREIQTISF